MKGTKQRQIQYAIDEELLPSAFENRYYALMQIYNASSVTVIPLMYDERRNFEIATLLKTLLNYFNELCFTLEHSTRATNNLA